MTARTPNEPGGGDVSETLSELERKLRELELQLSSTGPRPDNGRPSGAAPRREPSAPSPAPSPAVPPARPAAAADPDRLLAEARARLSGVGGQVDELLRFREQLQRTARELEDEYSRLLVRIGAPLPSDERPATAYDLPSQAPPPAAPAPALTPPPLSQPAVPGVGATAPGVDAAVVPVPPSQPSALPPTPTGPPPGAPVAAPGAPVAPAGPPPAVLPPSYAVPPQPSAPAAAPAASPHDDLTFEGPVVVDAGPFTDIAALSAFEQGLARVPGAEDVYVSGFEGNRALVELRLSSAVPLVREMRATLPMALTVTEASGGRLRVDVEAIGPGA
ncbi:MAG TPA: hypothetical protein VFR97_00400 [Capillimicrobium sp.]|nr:hypothetical protein [Capillimicrobium sp.]